MKIILVTTPLREEPSSTPPVGALSVINYLRKHGDADIDIEFFNIDAHRPEYADVLRRVADYAPDILAISAVVSTAYAYTKKLTQDVKRLLPSATVVVGGNLCASAEVLMRKAGVDVCVLGEGEKVFLNLVNHLKSGGLLSDLHAIPGLAFLDETGKMVNTGYEVPLSANEVWDVDWTDLERDGTLDLYFPVYPVTERKGKSVFRDDNRFDALIGTDKRFALIPSAKGCVARCTFCHRWDKGVRHIPVDIILKRLDYLIERYNVGVVSWGAEAFGTDSKWLNELLEKIEPYKILWRAGGVRASTVNFELIERMKAVGCFALIYGNETGSRKMLEVMEKKITLEENYNAAQWTVEAGLGNIIQLVVGMPGESPETIRETIEYCKFAACLSPQQDPRQISINFAQALPGTPLYEFARIKGLIGNGLDSEEEYLISVSDKDAADPLTCINFTNYSRLTLLSWNLLLRIEVRYHYMKKFGNAHYYELLVEDQTNATRLPEVASRMIKLHGQPTHWLFLKLAGRGRASALMACYPPFFYHLRRFVAVFTLLNLVKEYGVKAAWILIKDYSRHLIRAAKRPWHYEYRSLRKIVNQEMTPIPSDTPEMIPLRRGR